MIWSVLAGVASGTMSPSIQAALADIIGNERSGGKVLSTFQMTQDAGQIFAPVVVGAIAQTAGFTAAFGVCGAMCAVVAVLWLIIGKETMVKEPR